MRIGVAAARAGLAIAVTLAGCAQPVATDRPQLGAPPAGVNTKLGGPGAVGAGSFPRSFLMPGTDTSIRLAG